MERFWRRSRGPRWMAILGFLVAAAAGRPPALAQRPADSAGHGRLTAPPPGAKNASVQPASDPAGVTRGGPDVGEPKNQAEPQAAKAAGPADASSSAQLYMCGGAAGTTWTTTSAAFVAVHSCTLTLPEPGIAYINGSTSLALSADQLAYEARLSLGIDSLFSAAGADRWVNIVPDSGDGSDKSGLTTLVTDVTSGTHTFHLLAARYSGTGTVQLYDSALSVLFLPSSSARVRICGDSATTNWTTESPSFEPIRSCSMTINKPGFVYMAGSASLLYAGGPVEGRFRVGMDAISGDSRSDRWVNTYADSGDGVDESIGVSLISEVMTGTHTFYFSGSRYSGASPVRILNPTLAVVYFPAENVTAKVCGGSGTNPWTNATADYTVLRSCAVTVPRDSFAFVDANGSAAISPNSAGNEWEGQFRIGVDSPLGSSLFDRWVNTETDTTGDGTDRLIANTGLMFVRSGERTFYFSGRRYAGSGTVRVYAPTLSVLIPGGLTFFPFVGR